MAIHPILHTTSQVQAPLNPEQAANIEAWTEQATEALQSVSLSSGATQTLRGTSVTLAIPIDKHPVQSKSRTDGEAPRFDDNSCQPQRPSSGYRRREPIRRDSLKTREALLKGKEGSRRRQRWENDRLLNNPWAQPPLPSDWEVQPTYPRHTVPYYLAPLWDAQVIAHGTKESRKGGTSGKETHENPVQQVPKELRQKLKRAKAARGLLQDLEEEVRMFVERWNERERKLQQEGLHDVDSEEEEIVFVGRTGVMHDSPSRKNTHENLERDKLVFDGLADDRGASFGRWLVHSIATYYGLRTWSITVGDPARREAYVGIGDLKNPRLVSSSGAGLPRPLWGMV